METTLRTARPGDVAALVALFRALRAGEGDAVTEAAARRHVLRALARAGGRVVVAERGGRLVGYGEAVLARPRAGGWRRWLRRPAAEGAICYVYVDPAARGHGLGRGIVARLVADLRRGGARAVHASVRAGNDPSLSMFSAAGFRHASTNLRLDT
jgi:L-amino acid N-acyltransferase YncA